MPPFRPNEGQPLRSHYGVPPEILAAPQAIASWGRGGDLGQMGFVGAGAVSPAGDPPIRLGPGYSRFSPSSTSNQTFFRLPGSPL